MNPLETRARVLELQAELQRLTLAVRLEKARKRSNFFWLLPAVASSLGWLAKPRSGWLGLAWTLSRLYLNRRERLRKSA